MLHCSIPDTLNPEKCFFSLFGRRTKRERKIEKKRERERDERKKERRKREKRVEREKEYPDGNVN
jgi:hypothetical protein